MKRLTAKEEEIMRIFWENGPMFVRGLLAYYEDPKPHYNTVSTLVRGLEEKGFVGYTPYGNTYQYYALVSEKEYKSSALKEVISQYYNNSYVNVVSSFIEEEGLSVDELKALIDQIQRGKNENSFAIIVGKRTIDKRCHYYGRLIVLSVEIRMLPDNILSAL